MRCLVCTALNITLNLPLTQADHTALVLGLAAVLLTHQVKPAVLYLQQPVRLLLLQPLTTRQLSLLAALHQASAHGS